MSKYVGATIAGLGALIAGGSAMGGMTFFGPGPGGLAPKAIAGNPGTLQTSITLTEASTVTNVSVLMTSLVHSWLGELSATLTHVPSGKSASLFDRIGYSVGTPQGDATDFVGHYTFADGGTNLVTLALQLASHTAVPTGTYAASGTGGAPVSLATTFAGLNAAGEWRLTLQNWGGTDTGSMGSWKVGIDSAPLPAPGATTLALAGGAIAGLRRRRER